MLCYKTQRNHVVCNELSSGTVGWVVARGTVGFREFCSSNPEGSLFFFFFFYVSFLGFFFFRVRLSVRLSVRIRVRVRIVVWFRF